jgi:hypothetical protein
VAVAHFILVRSTVHAILHLRLVRFTLGLTGAMLLCVTAARIFIEIVSSAGTQQHSLSSDSSASSGGSYTIVFPVSAVTLLIGFIGLVLLICAFLIPHERV